MATPALPTDPEGLIRSRPYRVLLVIAALIGCVVSAASWVFLELVRVLQIWVYEDLPDDLGFDSMPWWWPLPWLALAGLVTALAIERLPGTGGHVPADGLKTGGKPIELPGVLLAAVATLGLVPGPEAPLIALGLALGILSMKLVKRDAPEQALGLMGAAGSFAAVSTIFGSPVIGSVIIIEASRGRNRSAGSSRRPPQYPSGLSSSSSCAKGSRGASRSGASAAAPPFRPSSSASSRG